MAGSEESNGTRQFAVEALLIHERNRHPILDYDVALVKLKGELKNASAWEKVEM